MKLKCTQKIQVLAILTKNGIFLCIVASTYTNIRVCQGGYQILVKEFIPTYTLLASIITFAK